MTPGLSKDVSCHVLPYFSKLVNHHQLRHQATHKVDCQPGDCIWSLEFSLGFVWYIWGYVLVIGLDFYNWGIIFISLMCGRNGINLAVEHIHS